MRKELNFKLYRMTKTAQKLTVLNRLENLKGHGLCGRRTLAQVRRKRGDRGEGGKVPQNVFRKK